MLDTAQEPRLLITHKDADHVYGACSLCEHRLHAFIRNTEQHALLLLNRGFKYHCRTRHGMVLPVPTRIATPRRSRRIPVDVLIEVQGERFASAGETVTVNLHGALVRISAPLKVGDHITIYVHRTGKSATAVIVFADDALSLFGVELERPENLWGVAVSALGLVAELRSVLITPQTDFHRLLSQKLTTRAAGFASQRRMYVNDECEINWDEFAHKFRLTFGREMTPDEHRWFHTIWTIVNRQKQETSNAAAA